MQLLLAAAFALITSVVAQNASYLTATAIITNAQNHSAFECWRFEKPLTSSSTPGIAGSSTLNFNSTGVEFIVVPPRFNGGVHNAPAAQLVAFTAGLAHISLPYPVTGNASQDEAWIVGGTSGLIVALDTTGAGHITTYPSDSPTLALFAPFPGGVVPAHEVLSVGPCHYNNIVGITT